MHVAPSRSPMLAVYVTLRVMPKSCRPARVVRRPGKTLVAFDPRETRFTITQWCVDHLTEEEGNAVRVGYGLPPCNTPSPHWITEDQPIRLFVPEHLRLTGATALQGGRELTRRREAGDLLEERAAYRKELRARAERRLMTGPRRIDGAA